MNESETTGLNFPEKPSQPGKSFRKSLFLYQSLVESVTVGIAVKDSAGRYQLANSAFAAALGRRVEEIVGRTDADLFSALDIPVLAEEDRRILAGEAVSARNLALPGKKPAAWVRIERKPLLGESGKSEGIVVTLRDVSAEKRSRHMAYQLMVGMDALTGPGFLGGLLERLCLLLGAEASLVARIMDDDPERLETFAFFQSGQIQEDFSYRLDCTPCRAVLESGKPWIIPDGVKEKFPQDSYVAGLDVRGYGGIRLPDSSGTPVGVLAILFRGPVGNVAEVENTLSLFQNRLGAELERAALERKLSESEAEKRLILSSFEDIPLHFANRDMETVWSNPSGAELWASTMGEKECCSPSGPPSCIRCAARHVLENGEAREDEIDLTGRGAYLVRSMPVRDDLGKKRGVLQVGLNVSQQKWTEAFRRESEHLYQGLFWGNPAVSWFLCPDTGDILEVNPAACRFYGYDADTLRGMKVWDINMLPKETVLETMAKAKRSALMFDPFPHRLADGSFRFVRIFSGPVRFRNRTCLYSIIVDVTEQHRAEKELRESRANLLAVLESTEDLIASRDRSKRLVVFNSAFTAVCRRALGVEPVPGLATQELLPAGLYHTWEKVLDRVLAGEHHGEEFSHTFPGGETRFYEIRMTPIWSENEIIGTAEFTRDITERKQADEELRRSEERFHSFMVHFPGLAFIKNADGRYIWANRSPTGDESIPPDRLVGRTDRDFFPPVFADSYQKTDQEVCSTGRRIQEVVRRPAQNRDRFQMLSKFPIGLDSPVTRIGGMAIDITELVDTRERLQAALEEKETLLREVHHRVKNNLAVINSLLALQHRRVKDSPAREALLESQARISAMALIHENLYKGDRLGEVEFQRYAEDLGRSLTVSMSTAIGARVSVDARGVVLPLNQAVTCGLILSELVTNSLKYAFSESKPGNIHISAREKANGWIAMRVKDDGAGLPPDFDQGRTLGIRIIRLLVERQLRGVWRTEGGKGACFVVEFPTGPE